MFQRIRIRISAQFAKLFKRKAFCIGIKVTEYQDKQDTVVNEDGIEDDGDEEDDEDEEED